MMCLLQPNGASQVALHQGDAAGNIKNILKEKRDVFTKQVFVKMT